MFIHSKINLQLIEPKTNETRLNRMELQANVNVQLDLLGTSVKKVSICKSVLKATEN
jgi:riboflavin synthase alpha subunit